ncbi:MAG: holo-ACP synthase [Firmicutes bacterium]|nr:holo-ACP synthase [Bacillota bacterium]
MITGNGIDIIEIKRLEAAIARQPRLLFRVFTTDELKYFKKRRYNIATIAGCFAAKEAAVKAAGCGFIKDVQISYDGNGKPLLTMKGKEKLHFFVSITHSKQYAAASVIATEAVK